jgi:glyceraldehyde-3-phosphate dehydrogenase/erythrose-4-phosphate dehydrogenase
MTYFSRCLKLLKINDTVTKKEIRKITEDTDTNAYLNSLLNFLEENEFIEVDRNRIPHYFIFHRKKFANFLRESKFFDEFGKIIEITSSIYVY